MSDQINEGDRISWRYYPQPRRFGRVYRRITGESGTVIGYRVMSDSGTYLVLSAGEVTKEVG